MNGDLEQLELRRGSRSGTTMAVAVHSTALGPGLGGARLWSYPDEAALVADATRLARVMTLKAAACGLELGGAKGVINRPLGEISPRLRREIMHDFGDLVESLDGCYITAEDVGTGAADMALIGERTRHVVGGPREGGGSGDPSPITAAGVLAAIRGCCRFRFGSADLSGRHVVVIGLGHVGAPLAAALAAAGARLTVTDIDPGRRGSAPPGAVWADPETAALTPCDVLAPCALGGAITAANVNRLSCAIVCGAANNVLANEDLAAGLAGRGIVYGPDFIANAGGLMSVYGELTGYGRDEALRLARGIEQTMLGVLEDAAAEGTTPLAAAQTRARARLRQAGATRGHAANRLRGCPPPRQRVPLG